MKEYTIGVDVGGTKIAYGLFDSKKAIVGRYKAKTPAQLQPSEMMDEMCTHIRYLLAQSGVDLKAVRGMGLALPSHILYDEGYVVTTSNLPTWNDVPVKKMFESRLPLRVQLDNDANVAAIAEHRAGAGAGKKNMLYVTISTGIGGGFILNNQIFRGSNGTAGEIGHMIISDEGYLCGCGNRGCVQSLASGPKIIRYARDQILAGQSSSLSSMVDSLDDLNCEHLSKAAKAGDALSIRTIERAGDHLGIMFANLYQALNIDHYVIGGGVSKIGPMLFDRFKEKFKSLLIMNCPVAFLPAAFGDDVGIAGAAMLIDD